MAENKIFTMSENGKSEYCCSVIRVGELTPVEGSDFLAKTDVFGTQIVVRKDQVHEGDIMFYAANETALNTDFLSKNNMFEIGCRDMNANADQVANIMKEYEDKYKNEADNLRAQAKGIKSSIDSMANAIAKAKKSLKKIDEKYDSYDDVQKANADSDRKVLNEKIDDLTKKSLEKTVLYTNLKKKVEELVAAGKPIVDEAKKLCGFFNKYGRVRCIVLKGCSSFGFLFGQNEMAKFCPAVAKVNLEDYLEQDFDTVDGVLFVKAFVPPAKPENNRKSKDEKHNKKLRMFDRLVEGEFSFHYDTTQLAKNMSLMDPDKIITATVKIHGTSCVLGKLHVREPKKIALYKKIWNWIVDNTGWFKKTRYIDYNIVYGPVYSSRTVIKNRYINKDVTGGFYGVDLWSEWGDIIYPYLDEGMTVYGEIYGYLTGTSTPIQKQYVYDCGEGENKMMPYRITTVDEAGTKHEWNVMDVYDWTLGLILRMKERGDENWKRIHPIDILWHGTLEDLSPAVATESHWRENILEKLKNDKEYFGMEEYEPLCLYQQVPREGIVIRIDDDPIREAFKLKTASFALGEAVLYDDAEYVDIEVQQGDYASPENDNV